MKKGVQLYTVRDHMGSRQEVFDSLRRIREIGYQVVQPYPLEAVSVDELQGMLAGLGLESCSANAELEDLEKGGAALEEAARQARLMGVDCLAIGTLPEELRESEAGFRAYAQRVNRVAESLKKLGLHMAYHPHALEFYSLGKGRSGMDILMGETDPEGLHFVLDTHWLAAAGVNVPKWIRRAKGRMEIVHLKDYAITGGARQVEEVHKRFAEVGQGNLDWPEILEACRELQVRYAVVEQDVCPGDPFESLAVSYRNLTGMGV